MTGKEFRKWRRMNDLTQKDIEELCDIDRTVISKWENEKLSLYESTYNRIIDFVEQMS